MKKTGKKLMSLLLAVIMTFGALPLAVFAESENVTTDSDVQLTATNTVGKLMTEVFDDVSAQGESYISEVLYADSTATVTFAVAKSARLVVAVYDDETKQMLDSEVASVSTSDTEKSVSFDVTLPEVFVIKAFLLDDNNKALCDAYSRKVDPKAYEEFMSKTTDDFEAKNVINLDNSKTNNFLVLADGVKKVSGSDKVNVLQSVDGDTYVFTNIDSALKALKAGDVFYLDNGDVNELTVIKIKSISINGSTATVVADEAATDELFEFVKISDEADETSFVIEEVGENFSIDNNVQASGWAAGDHMSEKQSFTLSYYENSVSAGGTVNLGIESTYFFYFSDEYSDVSYVVKPSFGIDISLSGTIAEKKIKLVKLSGTWYGIKVELGLDFVISASAKVELSGTWSAAIGARWDSVNGVANLSRRPEFKPEVKVEGKFFIGAEIELSASVIDKGLLGIAFEGGLGVVITATLSTDTDTEHSCKKCIDGDLGWEAGVDISLTILKIKDDTGVKFSKPLWSGSGKFCDFYYSFDFKDFGFTECPHKGEDDGLISFGSYPQSEVTDSTLLSALNSKSKTWVSYGYYSGTGYSDGQMTAKDYMKYADVTYNGNKYRAVTFSSYRPYFTADTSSSGTYQDDNGYTTNTVYWFKYEPLKWRVLDSTGLVICEKIIDSQAYNNYWLKYDNKNGDSYDDYYGNPSKTYYANNYANSSIREWLNDDFYNTAFTSSEKNKIKTTTLDNSAYSGYYSKYDSASTNDKVFLLSTYEATNSNYFEYYTARKAQSSNYAKCQGLYVHIENKRSYWHLRSASDASCFAFSIDYDGYVGDHYGIGYTAGGVRPALTLNLQSVISESSEVRTAQESTSTVVVAAADDSISYSFEDCVPGKKYILMNVADYSESFTLTEDNLYYIDEVTADENGVVSGSLLPKTYSADSTTLLFGNFKPCEIKITNAPTQVNYKASFTLGLEWENEVGDETVTWSSSDTTVLKVDKNGNVTSTFGRGTATITATVDGTDISDSVTITVKYTWWQWIIIILLFGWIWY